MNPLELVLMFIRIYSYILLARALISWIPNLFPENQTAQDIYNQVEPVLYRLTEPVLAPIRKLVPPVGGTMDISIMIAFFGLIIIQRMLIVMM
jgi:YggT family protein